MSSDSVGPVAMTSSRPYLLRAVHDWVSDNGLTPQIVVDAKADGVQVPFEYVQEDGRIVLNISPSAVRNLNLGNDWVSFSARFGGRPFEVFVPTPAVLAIIARETNAGMTFPPEEAAATEGDDANASDPAKARPALRPVDSGPAHDAGDASHNEPRAEDGGAGGDSVAAASSDVVTSAEDGSGDVAAGGPNGDGDTERPRRRKPALKVIK